MAELVNQVAEYAIPAGGKVRLVVGAAFGLESPLRPLTPVTLLDVMLPPQGKIVHTLPSSPHAFVHVIQGSGEFGAERSRFLHGVGDTITICRPGRYLYPAACSEKR